MMEEEILMALCDGHWVSQMADRLACEIMEQMADIHMHHCTAAEVDRPMDAVCGQVAGDCPMQLHFLAEPRLFRRVAQNMIGEEPEDDEEVSEYAQEFFNVLCGRFVSEIHQALRSVGKLYPVQYAMSFDVEHLRNDKSLSRICFMSDEQEFAEFSWTQSSMDELLRRSEKQ